MGTNEDTPRHALRSALASARRETDALFAALTPGALALRPIAERHRLVFYLGHVEAFDANLLVRDCARLPSRNEAYDRLFAFGIDPVDGTLPRDTPADWPGEAAIRAWSAAVRSDVDGVVATTPFEGWLTEGWAARIAVEHRLMHAETLAYLLHRLALRDVRAPSESEAIPASAATPGAWCDVPAGRATLGTPGARTGWDNEHDEHAVDVPAFRIARTKVTNGEWLAFVDAGGYRDASLWTAEDFAWRTREALEHPVFWVRRDGRWRWRRLFAEVALPLDAPVYASLAEARAYAHWQGAALPTEAQWHRAAFGTPGGTERPHPWGDAAPVPGTHGNFGFARFDPTPVGAHPAGRSAFGVDEMAGNGWEWTRTPFAPFPGFVPLPFYKGYSADFFDAKHFVLKGASPRTAACFVRRGFRNWFQPHYPHVYATVRLVDDGSRA